MEGKVVIITGANTGIGYETAKGLAKQGAHVIITSRSAERGLKAAQTLIKETGNSKIESFELDLAKFKSIRDFASAFLSKKLPLHVLVNNAGILPGTYSKPTDGKSSGFSFPFTITEDGNEITFQTNHLGEFLLTSLLLDTLVHSAPSRIVNVSSDAHAFVGNLDIKVFSDSTKYDPMITYAYTKLANILFTHELQRRLENKGITNVYVNSLHPGVVRTDITRENKSNSEFNLDEWAKGMNLPLVLEPNEGARSSIFVASDPKIEKENIKGKYFNEYTIIKETTPQSYNLELENNLWKLSEELTGVKSAY